MRISGSQMLPNVYQLYKQQLKEAEGSQSQTASDKKADGLALSRDLRDFQVAQQALMTLLSKPQDDEKLQALKDAIQNESYVINAQAIAEKMSIENLWSYKL